MSSKHIVSYIRKEPVSGVPIDVFQETIFHFEIEILTDILEDNMVNDDLKENLASVLGHELISQYVKAKTEFKN
jgi:hypothetical protein